MLLLFSQNSKPALLPPVTGYTGWYDGLDPAGNGILPGNNTSLATWVDKTANARHLTQSVAASQPKFMTNISNGRPGVLFDGVDDLIRLTTEYSLGANWTVFLVGKLISAANDGMFLASKTNVGGQHQIIRYQGGLNQFNFWNGPPTAYAYPFSFTTNQFVNILRVPSTIQINAQVNGVQMSNGSKSTVQSIFGQFGALGGDGVAAQAYLNAYMHEVLIYSTSLSNTDCALLTNYANQKWGVAA